MNVKKIVFFSFDSYRVKKGDYDSYRVKKGEDEHFSFFFHLRYIGEYSKGSQRCIIEKRLIRCTT